MADEQAAEVLAQDGPTAQDHANEAADAGRPTGEAEELATEIEGEEEPGEGKGKRLGGWQRKIQKLEREKDQLLSALTARGGAPEPSKDEPAATTELKPPAKPKQETFKTWEEFEEAKDAYYAAQTRYEVQKALQEDRQARTQQSAEEQVRSAFTKQIEEARKEHADFDQVSFSDQTPLTVPMHDAIVTSELGAEIAYHLGKHPEEAERIAKLSPVVAVREIGKIEALLAGRKREAAKDDDPEPPTSRAPRPPDPVRKANAQDKGLSDELPYREWVRRREAELKRT